MSLSRHEFTQVLAMAGATGFALGRWADADAAQAGAALYDTAPPFKGPGAVSLLHMTDCHAQLMPIRFREPSVNLGVADMQGRWPHLVGGALLREARIATDSPLAHALTHLDFATASRRYGKVGGFAHLATLVKRLKASRPGALLLDGGDTWQGSATALWTQGQDMVDAQLALGVDVMTGHWEFTYGMERVKQVVDGDFKGRGAQGGASHRVAFVAQNVKTTDFGDPVFEPYVMREVSGVPVAIVGQAFPYTPIANPRYFVADWSFGIQDEQMQKTVDDARAKGAQVVVVLSHNGMDVDLKMATRVRGIDAILGGHTHDGVPVALRVGNAAGTTLVTNAGSNGKFLGVMDLQVKDGKVVDFRYRLLPVFANLLQPDAAMAALIGKGRAPYEAKLQQTLAITDGLLYRRGNFNGAWDQLVCDALIDVQGAEIAFSPGFRWGTTLLPGETITRELMMDQLAITYPYTTLVDMSGAMIKTVLEDVADNLFNPDPYYQQGGDMVRVGGLTYTMTPGAKMGARVDDLRLNGKPLEADKTYKVAGWAPVSEDARAANTQPVWDVVEAWLAQQGGRVKPRRINTPKLIGVQDNPGLAP
jgi:sulfur-oxidizing protein SoxB